MKLPGFLERAQTLFAMPSLSLLTEIWGSNLTQLSSLGVTPERIVQGKPNNAKGGVHGSSNGTGFASHHND